MVTVKVEDQRSYPHIEGYYFDIKHVDEDHDERIGHVEQIEHVKQEENLANNQQDILSRHICSECGNSDFPSDII